LSTYSPDLVLTNDYLIETDWPLDYQVNLDRSLYLDHSFTLAEDHRYFFAYLFGVYSWLVSTLSVEGQKVGKLTTSLETLLISDLSSMGNKTGIFSPSITTTYQLSLEWDKIAFLITNVELRGRIDDNIGLKGRVREGD